MLHLRPKVLVEVRLPQSVMLVWLLSKMLPHRLQVLEQIQQDKLLLKQVHLLLKPGVYLPVKLLLKQQPNLWLKQPQRVQRWLQVLVLVP
jgi:hypothetical protein